MEAFRFIKWWWSRQLDDLDRSVFKIISYCLLVMLFAFLAAQLFGHAAAVWVIVASVFGTIGYFLFSFMFDQWRKYLLHKEREAQEIMNRLQYGSQPDFGNQTQVAGKVSTSTAAGSLTWNTPNLAPSVAKILADLRRRSNP